MAGTIESVTTDHKLVYGLSPSFPYYGDFGVVNMIGYSSAYIEGPVSKENPVGDVSNRVATRVGEFFSNSEARLVSAMDYGTKFAFTANDKSQPWLEKGKRYSLDSKLPFIVSSQIGGRVAYYAVPIESLVEGQNKDKALIEQMYYGMLYK